MTQEQGKIVTNLVQLVRDELHDQQQQTTEIMSASGVLVGAINTLTNAVHESNGKIDKLSDEMIGMKIALESNRGELLTLATVFTEHKRIVTSRFENLETRQEKDETFRLEALKDAVTDLRMASKTHDDHARSRRNYWISVIVTFFIGIASAITISWIRTPAPAPMSTSPAVPQAPVRVHAR